MAIIGMTDERSVRATLPRLGQLRKGKPKTAAGHVGREQEGFRFRPFKPGMDKIWRAAFSTDPIHLTVYLPFATWAENFETCKEAWTSGRLQHRCDGVTTELLYDKAKKSYSKAAHPCPGGCKEVGRLNVVIPAFLRAKQSGTVSIETHGIWDLINIAGELKEMQRLANMHGSDMTGMQITVYRVKESKPTPEGGRQDHWNIHTAMSAAVVRRQIESARVYAIGSGEPLALDDGTVIDNETGEILESPRKEQASEPRTEAVSKKKDRVPKARTPRKARKPKPKVEPKPAKTKAVSLKGASDWKIRANELADDHPAYMGENGPDMAFMLQTAGELGFAQVTRENLEEVMDALSKHAQSPEPEKVPEQPSFDESEAPF